MYKLKQATYEAMWRSYLVRKGWLFGVNPTDELIVVTDVTQGDNVLCFVRKDKKRYRRTWISLEELSDKDNSIIVIDNTITHIVIERWKENKKMIITGKYYKDSNFTTVFCNNTMYTIARNTGEWGCLAVGELSAMGKVLTQESYDKLLAECDAEGTFELEE